MKRIAHRLGASSSPELAKAYPNTSHRSELESIFHDIGSERLGFDSIRGRDDFAIPYGIPGSSSAPSGKRSQGGKKEKRKKAPTGVPAKPIAYAIKDPRAVRKLLKNFAPRGNGREKVVTLRDEAIALDIADTPLAFCFVLRSMIEISGKAYSKDHSLPITKSGGKEMT